MLTLTLLLSSSRQAGHMTSRRRRRIPTFIRGSDQDLETPVLVSPRDSLRGVHLG